MIAALPAFALAVEARRKTAPAAAATVSIAAVAATSVVVVPKTNEPVVESIRTKKGLRGVARLLMPRAR